MNRRVVATPLNGKVPAKFRDIDERVVALARKQLREGVAEPHGRRGDLPGLERRVGFAQAAGVDDLHVFVRHQAVMG